MNKLISVSEIVYGRLKDLKLCERDTFNDVVAGILDERKQSTYYAVIECKITGDVCHCEAHCEICDLARDKDKLLKIKQKVSGDE
jgi:predicted CopG family antitoxin